MCRQVLGELAKTWGGEPLEVCSGGCESRALCWMGKWEEV